MKDADCCCNCPLGKCKYFANTGYEGARLRFMAVNVDSQ